MAINSKSSLKAVSADPEGHAILDSYIHGYASNPMFGMVANIQHNMDSRPETCRNIEETSTDLDKFAWEKIDTDLKVADWGTITPAVAADRIIDQVKRGHFYIYTHRNLVKGMVEDKAHRMLTDRAQFDPSNFMAEYYMRKNDEN